MSYANRTSPYGGWAVSYTQGDVDTIREQIEQTESAKRRWIILLLMISVGALVGAVVLLTTSYALYSSSKSEIKSLASENASLKTRVAELEQQVGVLAAEKEKGEQARAASEARFEQLLPAVLGSRASDTDIASFARMVSDLPRGRIETETKPPDRLFRNWKAKTDTGMEIYTMVGGFVDGKWLIHSNLVARR
jgi:cell division protein FtsB